MARGGAARRLAGVGGLGATEGLLACGLVQKKEHDMSKPLECTGWLIEAQLWLAVMRGGLGRRRGVRGHLKGCYRLRFLVQNEGQG